MNITLASAAGQPPSAVEWTLTYLGSDILDITVTAGPSLQVSGKNIACNQFPGNDTCLVTGLNANAIPDGVVAIVTVTPSPTATGLSNLVNSEGSDSQGNSLALSAFNVTPGGTAAQIPVTAMVTPLPGMGITQTFLVTITDPDGFANVTALGIGFLDATAQPSSCYSLLDFPGKELYLINDDGSSYHNPPAIFGASGTVENSYCRIDTSAVTVSGAGSVLSLALPVTFKTSGVKNIYAYATNAAGGSETYHALGTWTASAPAATLSVAKIHNGSFSQGQTGSYTVTVSNIGAAATDGTAVTVVDTLPSGLTAAAMTGAGWTCNVSTASCARSDSLGVNTSYPAINLTVNIAVNAAASLTNQVNVSGGGQLSGAGASATDTASVAAVAAAVSATGGTPQNTTIATAFASVLQATVKDGGGAGLAGVTVTFTVPANGASGTFAGGSQTAVTNNVGVATSPIFTANNMAGGYTVTASAGVTGNAGFSLTNSAGAPSSMTATSGSGQSTVVGTAFGAPLVATVRDSAGNPIVGFAVTFTAPASGASGQFMGQIASVASTNASGIATSSVFTANNTAGVYNVIASSSAVGLSASFSLTNSNSTADTIPPVVTIKAPLSGASVTGNVSVQASATDNVKVTKIELDVDGAPVTTANSASLSFTWNSTTTTNGSHTLTVKAFDAANNVGSASVIVTVNNDTTPPTVTITQPANGSHISSNVNITTAATDNVQVKGVSIFIDNVLVKSCGGQCNYLWNISHYTAGSHTITAKAWDAAGNVGNASPVTVTLK